MFGRLLCFDAGDGQRCNGKRCRRKHVHKKGCHKISTELMVLLMIHKAFVRTMAYAQGRDVHVCAFFQKR